MMSQPLCLKKLLKAITKEIRTVCEYKGKEKKNGSLNLKFLPSYPLPKPNITSLKDLFDLEG